MSVNIKENGQLVKTAGLNSQTVIIDNLTTQDATKALSAKQGYVLNQNKVDKVSGKGLSTEDYTTEEKNKLAGIPTVNNGTLTIQRNGVNVQTFSANQSTNVTANILVDELTEVTDNEPYVLRQGKGDMVDMELVGGSFAWNQLVQNGNFASTSYWGHYQNDWSVSGNVVTLTSTATGTGNDIYTYGYTFDVLANHKYLVAFDILYTANVTGEFNLATNDWSFNLVRSYNATANVWKNVQNIITHTANVSGVRFMIYTFKNPTASVGNVVKIKNVNLIDLTQLFGTTIADAIYAMEQASTGSGVAFFRKYFPNAYYAYDTGSIENVNVASRKVVGKNLYNVPLSLIVGASVNNDGTNVSGKITASNGIIGCADQGGFGYRENVVKVMPNTKYTFSVTGNIPTLASRMYIQEGDENKNFTTAWRVADGTSFTFTTSANTEYVILNYTFTNATVGDYISINFQVEFGNTATAYEPYEEHVYPFDTIKQLRGIPSLVNNKLVYDGDIYTPNGITRKYGIVNLGSLTWTYDSTFSHMVCSNIGFNIGSKEGLLCAKYTTQSITSWGQLNDKCIARHPSDADIIRVYDSAYTDPTTFKTAMNGVYLVYKLATPTTESAEPYQNPQRSDASGTEEFVDYEYDWMHNRDVAIPVGHNTKYISSEVLAYSEDYADGLLKYVENDLIPPKADITALTNYDFSGMTTAPLSISKDDYFYMDGFLCKALVNINQGATLTYYTNYITCSVATELNELRNKTEWHEVLSGTQTLSTTEDETLMWTEQSYYPTYFGCDFFVFSDLAGFYLKDFSYGGHDGSITFPKWSSAVTVNYKIMARGEANQSGSGITTYYNAPILNQ